jgi:hypothetical protein
MPTNAAILFAPTLIGLHRNANLSNGLLNRLALTLQHLNLPKLQHYLFGFVSLSSHLLVLLKMG